MNTVDSNGDLVDVGTELCHKHNPEYTVIVQGIKLDDQGESIGFVKVTTAAYNSKNSHIYITVSRHWVVIPKLGEVSQTLGEVSQASLRAQALTGETGPATTFCSRCNTDFPWANPRPKFVCTGCALLWDRLG